MLDGVSYCWLLLSRSGIVVLLLLENKLLHLHFYPLQSKMMSSNLVNVLETQLQIVLVVTNSAGTSILLEHTGFGGDRNHVSGFPCADLCNSIE